MKNFILLLSVFLLVFCLCACGRQFSEENHVVSNKNEETTDYLYEEEEATSFEAIEDSGEYITPVETTEYSTVAKTTKEHKKENPTVTPHTFGTWDLNDTNIFPQIRIVTRDTPGHNGVNLRKEPDNKSDLIMTIPEGTEVLLLDEMENSDSYWKVAVKADGTEYRGYVIERYISTFSGIGFDHTVSYNTPDHAGVVLRAEATNKSEKIVVLPEGTELRVWADLDDSDDKYNDEYWSVDAYYNGKIYKGYMLHKYID